MQDVFDEISAGIILFRQDITKKLFLLLHYPSGHWDFIKGRIEKNELAKDAAIREAYEETGITDIEFIENFEKRIQYTYQFEGRTIKKQVIFFLAKTRTSNIVISNEHIDFIWLDFDNALTKTTYQNAKDLLIQSRELVFSS